MSGARRKGIRLHTTKPSPVTLVTGPASCATYTTRVLGSDPRTLTGPTTSKGSKPGNNTTPRVVTVVGGGGVLDVTVPVAAAIVVHCVCAAGVRVLWRVCLRCSMCLSLV